MVRCQMALVSPWGATNSKLMIVRVALDTKPYDWQLAVIQSFQPLVELRLGYKLYVCAIVQFLYFVL